MLKRFGMQSAQLLKNQLRNTTPSISSASYSFSQFAFQVPKQVVVQKKYDSSQNQSNQHWDKGGENGGHDGNKTRFKRDWENPIGGVPILGVVNPSDDDDEKSFDPDVLDVYTEFKKAFADAKASTDMADNQRFVEKALPKAFQKLRELGVKVDDMLVHELLAVFAAYVKLDKGWKFDVEVDVGSTTKTFTYEVESVHCPDFVGKNLAESTAGVAPVPGGSSWKVSVGGKPERSLILLTGTSSVGRSKDRKLAFRASGAYSDADKEIGCGFIEDEVCLEWIQQCIGESKGRDLYVAGHSLGAAGAQVVCRTVLEQGWKDPQKLFGFFLSPPSPSKPPPPAWSKIWDHFHFCTNGADPVSGLGGRYLYPGKEFVLSWGSTPWVEGSQDVYIDKVLLSHGKPNLLFARACGVPCDFVARKSVTEKPSEFADAFWKLMDWMRQGVAHKGFKPTVPERVVAHVESYLRDDFPPMRGQRGYRVAALEAVVREMAETCPLGVSPEFYVNVLATQFDQLFIDTSKTDTLSKVTETAAYQLSEILGYETQDMGSSHVAAFLMVKNSKFELKLAQAVEKTRSAYNHEAKKEYWNLKDK